MKQLIARLPNRWMRLFATLVITPAIVAICFLAALAVAVDIGVNSEFG